LSAKTLKAERKIDMDEEKKFLVCTQSGSGLAICRVGARPYSDQIMTEEQALARMEMTQQNFRVFEIIERKVETKKAIV